MMHNRPQLSARRVVLGVLTLAAACLVLLGVQLSARAIAPDDITLSGTVGPDDFLIAIDPTDDTRLMMCAEVCFTRARAEIGSVLVTGFDGDDSLTIQHGAILVSNGAGDLGVSFQGGAGNDQLEFCTGTGIDPCTVAPDTTVTPGASVDERVVTQSTAGASVTVTTNDVATIRDEASGPVSVSGTTAADQIGYDAAAGDPTTGRITVDTMAPYLFGGKSDVTLDTGDGADAGDLGTTAGLDGSDADSASTGTPAARVCVHGDSTADDTIALTGATDEADQVTVSARAAGAAHVGGLAAVAALDLTGMDAVDLSLQTATDSLRLVSTSAADDVRAAVTTTGIALTGDLATDATAFALPAITVTGDGVAPLDLTADLGDGADQVQLTGSDGNDAMRLGPTGASTPCTAAGSHCLEVTPDGLAGTRLTLAHVEQQLLQAAGGDDTFDVAGDIASGTTWRGGDGADSVRVHGTGPALTVDLADSSVQQNGAATTVLTATEQLDVEAAGGSVTTTATTGDDDLTFQPETSDSGTLQLAGSPMTVHLGTLGGTDRVDLLGGDDAVTVRGTTAADRFAVGRGAELSAQVGALLPARFAGAEHAELQGLGGDDEFDVTGSADLPLVTTVGGTDAAADTLKYAASQSDTAVSVDDDLGTGQLSADGSAIGFQGIEQVTTEGDGGHQLSVTGSDGADTLTQHGNTVTVNRTTDVTFSGFPRLVIGGGAADDQLWVDPSSTSGVAGITASGGGETDTLTVQGTALSERVVYTPSAAGSGTVAVGTAPTTTFDGVEDSRYDGRTVTPSGDTLVVDTPQLDGTLQLEPGSTYDTGTVRFQDVAGSTDTAAPLTFGALGRGEVRFAGDPSAPQDKVVVLGRPGDDVMTVTTRATSGGAEAVETTDEQVPVAVPGAHTLVLDGRDGADVFRLPTDHPLPGQGGPGLVVRGGSPDSGDRLVLTSGGADLVDDLAADTVTEAGHAAVGHSGVDAIDLAAAGGDVRELGSEGPDDLSWTPTGAAAGRIAASGSPVLTATALGELVLDPAGGADHASVALRSVDDDVTIARGPSTEVAVTGLEPVTLAPSVESATVATNDGSDHVTVVGSGGPAALQVDGGAPAVTGDVLRLESPTAAVTYATDHGSGQLASPGGNIGFAAVETLDVAGDGSGALSVNGSDAAETVTIGESADPRIRVDGSAAVTYHGYPDVALSGGAGNDDVTVGYTSLGDIDRLQVDGGAGSADALTVVDTAGTTRPFTVRPTAPAGSTLTAAGFRTAVTSVATESLSLDGSGGDDQLTVVTPTGAQAVRVAPGSTDDSGDVVVGSLQPFDFRGIGAEGRVTVSDDDGLRVDSLTLEGTGADDTSTIDGPAGEVRRTGWVPLGTPAVLDLVVRGGDGDDHADVTGPLPYRTTSFEGNGPDLGDSMSLQGPEDDVTVDLGRASVRGYGGEILFPGVVALQTDAGGRTLTQVGTPRDDAFCYDPMAPRDGRLYIVGAPGGGTATSVCDPDLRGTNVLNTFVEVGKLVLDPADGSDEVIVDGTTSRDLISVQAHAPLTEVAVHSEPDNGSTFRLPLEAVVASTESVVVAADNGSDSVDVTAYDSSAPLITVYGESPATMKDADSLVLRDGTGAAHLSDITSHTKGSGTVLAEYPKGSGAVIRVDYVDVELVDLIRDPKAN
jgi:hypothetical protein